MKVYVDIISNLVRRLGINTAKKQMSNIVVCWVWASLSIIFTAEHTYSILVDCAELIISGQQEEWRGQQKE